jgi:hypothetical protein
MLYTLQNILGGIGYTIVEFSFALNYLSVCRLFGRVRHISLHLGKYGYCKLAGVSAHACKFKKLVPKGIACEVIV